MPDGWINRHIPQAHCEEANDTWEYEKKEHSFWCSEDTPDVLKLRYGKPNALQNCILKIVSDQNDRQIDVFLDKKGNSGKTWLAQYLWEKGAAYYVPRSVSGTGKVSADCCSNCGNARYIILDIQRDKKFDSSFYADIEELKDGLVSDVRWHGKQRNLRGRKLVIFTNHELDTRKLSMDRWRLHSTHLRDLEMELHERKQKRIEHSMELSTKTKIHTRQTKIDKIEDTGLNRTAKEEQKCTEDADITDAEPTDAGTDTAGAGGEVQ